MTDHKFTDDVVVETLKNAKYKVDGVVSQGVYLSVETFNAVVDLIGRQKAEIEEKSKNITFAAKELIRLDRERSEVINEFAERLKSDLGRIPQHQFTRSQVEWSINTFVKEMTEGNHESQST